MFLTNKLGKFDKIDKFVEFWWIRLISFDKIDKFGVECLKLSEIDYCGNTV